MVLINLVDFILIFHNLQTSVATYKMLFLLFASTIFKE